MRETLRISARADYAIRATVAIAAVPDGELVTADALASTQDIPLRFLLVILNSLRHAGIVESRRGHGGGYRLARSVESLTLAEIISAVDVAPSDQHWLRAADAGPESDPTARVHALWSSLRTSLHGALERTTIADVLDGRQPSLR
jgi:Rrf2 family protein